MTGGHGMQLGRSARSNFDIKFHPWQYFRPFDVIAQMATWLRPRDKLHPRTELNAKHDHAARSSGNSRLRKNSGSAYWFASKAGSKPFRHGDPCSGLLIVK